MDQDGERQDGVIGAAEIVGEEIEKLTVLAARGLQFEKPFRRVGAANLDAQALQKVRIVSEIGRTSCRERV